MLTSEESTSAGVDTCSDRTMPLAWTFLVLSALQSLGFAFVLFLYWATKVEFVATNLEFHTVAASAISALLPLLTAVGLRSRYGIAAAWFVLILTFPQVLCECALPILAVVWHADARLVALTTMLGIPHAIFYVRAWRLIWRLRHSE